MLTLFAIGGLTFVLYAGSAAEPARLDLEAEPRSQPDVKPELAFFASQLLYISALFLPMITLKGLSKQPQSAWNLGTKP